MIRKLLFLLLVAGLTACGTGGVGTEPADTLYHGGPILTMADDSTAETVEAIAVANGKIIFTGTFSEAKRYQGDSTHVIDLGGKTMLPGFVDAHGHVWMCGFQEAAANLLPPPDGTGSSIAALQDLLRTWQSENQGAISKYGWIVGFGYDDSQLAEKRHPTAADLDKVSTEHPVLIVHQSGHLGVLNSKGLELAKLTAASKDPAGGVIQRKPGSNEPTGVLEEMAFFQVVFGLFANIDEAGNEKIAKMGLQAYARQGFTTAQEGRASQAAAETWRSLAERGDLLLDVAVYPDLQQELAYLKQNPPSRSYTNGFRIAGVKLSFDGSPQGKTAWLSQPYHKPPAGQPASYNGYPAFASADQVQALIDTVYSRGWQLLAHTNGDAAIAQYLQALRKAENKYGKADRRPVIVHGQAIRADQLDSAKMLGVIPSLFGMHAFYWGDWHREETLGPVRAENISPAQWAIERNMVFTQHHDAPVALPSAIMILYSVVNRTTRTGYVLGPDQRLTPYQALLSLTKWPAYQYFEEATKGTLEVGKVADFVILDRNPLTIPAPELKDLQVVETVKAGKTIYTKQ